MREPSYVCPKCQNENPTMMEVFVTTMATGRSAEVFCAVCAHSWRVPANAICQCPDSPREVRTSLSHDHGVSITRTETRCLICGHLLKVAQEV